MEWTHIEPHAFEARHVQRFSISIDPLITSPARYEVEPSWTMPFKIGGAQSDERTRSPATAARAFFTISQPAILARNSSLI
jgi:hypothetical protein